ncbi:hypothetical protein PT974_07260 [Cladobotryum mycophilum]|uniref:Uncharacterized protein n=1 Tax=Cladobotryum mycophilum TaxID=491253 RepID=A0ABR0SNR3_9HYPO
MPFLESMDIETEVDESSTIAQPGSHISLSDTTDVPSNEDEDAETVEEPETKDDGATQGIDLCGIGAQFEPDNM